MKRNKGFTLIELLVVIAIIGILSSVVLASLNTARGKGANAAVKSNLANIRPQAELVYDDNSGSYAAVCTDGTVVKAIAAAQSAGGAAKCIDTSTDWSAAGQLKTAEGTSTHWCVDDSGTAKGITTAQYTALADGAPNCP
ncbi:hypothetical protein COW81_02650 [Candidatus Campbellbacteria bacterium CG22_combo_CG10-13_8_21_14_all_36_13]|uniref:Prepilin-type cleavage/methylation domain-containing protein n=1 Tax=Candidatus Campbellbacteria bacterium CG22_combo_CG10-13_8_21_14_all_36_13 TaxID=1974529 RepID=A0A2H0DYP3_9BACT|nr:MAG: hypothetical protein COW81_02650 [Candidatus Campbellbacteria bacterium CG22_combo_CG10-13_8_21_14_all_36_13]